MDSLIFLILFNQTNNFKLNDQLTIIKAYYSFFIFTQQEQNLQEMPSSDDQDHLTHTHKLGNSQFEIFCKSQPQTAHLMFSIEKYLCSCPAFYYKSLLIISKGRSIDKIKKTLQTEYQRLISEKSFYHMICKALTSRQKCIQKIKRELSKAQKILKVFKQQYYSKNNSDDLTYLDYVQQQGYSNVEIQQTIEDSIKLISSIFIDMSRLRDMSLYLVQTVHKWKIQIQEWADKCNQYQPIEFIHKGKSVYDIILDDTLFIWESSLSNYIWLDIKNDPFIVRNVLKIQQKQVKTILEKYFVEILYPKNQQTVSRAVKCSEMLTYKYQPQVSNLYREEQLLIQNYLQLQKDQKMQEGIKSNQSQQVQWQQYLSNRQKQTIAKQKLNPRGWVFGKNIKKSNTQKVKEIIQKHQIKMTALKSFNISNFIQKKSLALQYLAKSNYQPSKTSIFNSKRVRSSTSDYVKMAQTAKPPIQNTQQRLPQQQPKSLLSQRSKSMKTFSKFGPVILQDPLEQNRNETPIYSNRKNKNKNVYENNFFTQSESKQSPKKKNLKSIIKKGSQTDVETVFKRKKAFSTQKMTPTNPKINTLINFKSIQTKQENCVQKQMKQQKHKKNEEIIVDQQQKQIDFSQFLQTFRANTAKKQKNIPKKMEQIQKRNRKIQQNEQKLITIKQLISANSRLKSKSLIGLNKKSNIFNIKGKSLYNSRRSLQKISNRRIQNGNNKSQQSVNNASRKSQHSFDDFKPAALKQGKSVENIKELKFSDQFIILHAKTIPIDIAPMYIRHIYSQIHSTSKKFTIYNQNEILKKIQDPYTHCIIFDVSTEKKGLIGQIILSESVSINSQKLKYTIQFINIHIFELVVASILRVTEELLYATPCHQVICPLIEDKIDPVSVHFIQLIQNSFKAKVQSFGGNLSILEKKKLYYKDHDIYEKLYIFSAPNKRAQLKIESKQLNKNYRSLKFECKCLMLSSNFRMRSKSTQKNVISNYNSTSIGYLYRRVLEKIITKYHLKQIKTSSNSSNDSDQTVSLIKQSSFLRSEISSLTELMKEGNQKVAQLIYLTKFSNMSELLTYLEYKQYSQHFHFAFLEESRFILNHQLYLSELQFDFALEMMVRISVDFLILYNSHHLPIKYIPPNSVSQAKSVILPTTHDDIDLILIDGKEYENQTTDKLDLFSYLTIYQSNLKNYQIKSDISEISIPNLQTKGLNNMNSIKLFDGLFRLFPEREFYSGTYFKCANMWESYFPSAVIYQPTQNSVVFQYPLIVGFLHRQRQQIVSAFLLKDQNE